MPYDLTPYLDPETEGVCCRVTATLPDGTTRTAEGVFLHQEGYPVLRCGIYDLCAALALPDPEDAKCLEISAAVDKQLRHRPRADLICPEMSIRLNLIPPPC